MVEEQRQGIGVSAANLVVADEKIQIVVGLRPRRDRIRRRAAVRRNQQGNPVAEVVGALGDRERRAVDDEHGVGRAVEIAAGGLETARDALEDPVILVRPEQVKIAGEHLLGVPLHFRRRHAGIDSQIAQRLVEAHDVLFELEDAVPEGASRIEAAIAVTKAAVAEGDHGPTLRHDLPIEVADPLVRALSDHLFAPRPCRPPTRRRAIMAQKPGRCECPPRGTYMTGGGRRTTRHRAIMSCRPCLRRVKATAMQAARAARPPMASRMPMTPRIPGNQRGQLR